MLGQTGLRSVYTRLVSELRAPTSRLIDIDITRKHKNGIPKRSVGASVLHPALVWQLAAVSGMSWLEPLHACSNCPRNMFAGAASKQNL